MSAGEEIVSFTFAGESHTAPATIPANSPLSLASSGPGQVASSAPLIRLDPASRRGLPAAG
jgi:hypothetical protein